MIIRNISAALISTLLLAGCAAGGPNDLMVIDGHGISQSAITEGIDQYKDDPLYQRLLDIIDPQTLDMALRQALQVNATNQYISQLLAEKFGVQPPTDKEIDDEFERQAEEIGGVEKVIDEIVQQAEMSGSVQGPVSSLQFRDQVEASLIYQRVLEEVEVTDEELDDAIATYNVPEDQQTEEVLSEIRKALASQKVEKEISELDIKNNPKFMANQGVSVLGNTVPNPDSKAGGLDGFPTVPAGDIPQIEDLPQEVPEQEEATEEELPEEDN